MDIDLLLIPAIDSHQTSALGFLLSGPRPHRQGTRRRRAVWRHPRDADFSRNRGRRSVPLDGLQ